MGRQMSTVPSKAKAVVIGAGIVGNSLAYHLARLGWRDIVQIDKGPLPNPGGSTGHASNFIFPVDHSKEMTAITADSVRQYTQLGTFTKCGGIEVARTPARLHSRVHRLGRCQHARRDVAPPRPLRGVCAERTQPRRRFVSPVRAMATAFCRVAASRAGKAVA